MRKFWPLLVAVSLLCVMACSLDDATSASKSAVTAPRDGMQPNGAIGFTRSKP